MGCQGIPGGFKKVYAWQRFFFLANTNRRFRATTIGLSVATPVVIYFHTSKEVFGIAQQGNLFPWRKRFF
jgi:hypothetical protein